MKEKRDFTRYDKNADVVVTCGEKSFRGRMRNYSLTGLQAEIDASAGIGRGDGVRVSAADPSVGLTGNVVWMEEDGNSLLIGVRSLGRLSGRVRDFDTADTLIGIQRTRKTGILSFTSGAVSKRVYIKEGDMIFAASNLPEDRLGDILLAEGKITREQFDQSAVELKKTGQRQGAVLVKMGYLSPSGLVDAVRHQVETIIESLFELQEGVFSFEERPLPTEEVITLKLSAANLIYRGIRKMRHEETGWDDFPPGGRIVRFNPDPLDLFQDLKPDAAAAKILSLIDGSRTVDQVIELSGCGRDVAFRTLHALSAVRIIESSEEKAEAAGIPDDIVEAVCEEEDDFADEFRIRGMIEEMHLKYRELGYYGVLGVNPSATHSEIKSAYYRTAKTFHPDMHFHLGMNDIKHKLSDIFTFVYEAYNTLADPAARKKYDDSRMKKPEKEASPAERAAAFFEEGKRMLSERNFVEAEHLFGKAKYLDPKTAEYHYHFGVSLVRQGRFKSAGKALNEALKLAPDNANYLVELGFIHLEMGFPLRAKGLFEKALELSPGNMPAKAGLGRIPKDALND